MIPKRAKKACVVAAALAAAGLARVGPAAATGTFTFARVAGADRYATDAAAAEAAFPSGSATAILATGTDFPDAIAGSFLAGNLKAAMLLTTPTAPMPAPTAHALQALGVHRVVILGGTSAVGAGVQQELASAGYAVSRIAGQTRYDTMQQIAEQPGLTIGTDSSGERSAILATGDDFPDALSAGPLAYADKLPVVLTDGSAALLTTQAFDVLTKLSIRHVVIAGGSSVIKPTINAELMAMGITIDQQGGSDRSATSADIADDEISSWGLSPSGFTVARGDTFPDALAGAVLAGARHEPLLVTPGPAVPGSVTSFASAHASTESTGSALGGAEALADNVLSEIASAAGGHYPPDPPGSPYPSGAQGYDISWPQCGQAYPPGGNAVAVVGANDGYPFSVNPCLASEASWAGPALSLYINLASPGGSNPSQWMTGPAGNCPAADTSCQSYNYGWNAATYSMSQASGQDVSSQTWWLDVETGNSWSSSTSDNAQVIQGAIDALEGAGKKVGAYSTAYQWGQIAGSYSPKVASWVATGGGSSDVQSWCAPSNSFTNGPVWLVQYGRGTWDGDYSC